jgi:hypothetical protein
MNPQLVSQSFLGSDSDAILAGITAGIVGLGGGGSHMVQQLAHVGLGGYVPVDDDVIEHKNLNRLVGATVADVIANASKTAIAERVIRAINPNARVAPVCNKWQNAHEQLRSCDILIGCVDSYAERAQLERFARRFLIPYIDLGMDVHESATGFSVAGQVVLSSPGGPCLWCYGILTQERLKLEAEHYGKAGGRPQVVWSNGVLASIAVGLIVQLICPWGGTPIANACREIDGNLHVVERNRDSHSHLLKCTHYADTELGDPFFTRQSLGLRSSIVRYGIDDSSRNG